MHRRWLVMEILLMAIGCWSCSPYKEVGLSDKVMDWQAGEAIEAVRFAENPIIHGDMLAGDDGVNINGPSLIRVPDWLPEPLGRYYLYFANHGGQYIRLAYADDLHGPWKVYEPGTLKLSQTPSGRGHIASPDVHVDDDSQELRMYYHGVVYGDHGRPIAQRSYVARSNDGLAFVSDEVDLGPFYFRVFRYGGYWYTSVNGGYFLRSADGVTAFEEGEKLLNWEGLDVRVRHTAVYVVGDHAWVFYSRIGDSPERLMVSRIELDEDWLKWEVGEMSELLQPEMDYEGADLAVGRSVGGLARSRVHQLRDPGIYVEDGKVYLLYNVAGESGIGMAELVGE